MKIDKSKAKPLHEQAESYLRALIVQPEYRNGKMLPPETVIAKQLGISRTTIRQAINSIVMDGLLVRKKGLGTKVSKQVIVGHGKEWKSFTQEMKALGMVPKNFEIFIKWEKASEDIAKFFNIRPGEMILRSERLRGSEDEAFVFFTSNFNPKIGLTGNENFSEPLYDMLEHSYNIVAKTSHEIISAEKAEQYLASKLGISVGDPVLKRERRVFDKNGLPIEHNIGIYKAESFKYSITLQRSC